MRSKRMQLKFELRDHAEVATATTNTPEQVLFLVVADGPLLAVGSHHRCATKVVDGKPVLAIQPAEAAAERKAANAGMRDDPGRRDQPMLPARWYQGHSAMRRPAMWHAASRIDRNSIHLRQVDHQAVIANRLARPAVPAAAYSDEQVALPRKGDSLANVRLNPGSERLAPAACHACRSRCSGRCHNRDARTTTPVRSCFHQAL